MRHVALVSWLLIFTSGSGTRRGQSGGGGEEEQIFLLDLFVNHSNYVQYKTKAHS